MNAPGRRAAYLAALGIDEWCSRRVSDKPPEFLLEQVEPVPLREPAAPGTPGPGWPALEDEVRGCTKCALRAGCTQTVFGVGSRNASWMVIGEAPGQQEDEQGEPFVGRAGQLLNSMLRAIDLARGDVFIANILKCRPPNNRDPQPTEVATCLPYLQRQIDLIRPRILLAVGRIAAQNLLATDTPIGKLRGKVHRFGTASADGGTPLVITYHPAYLLRSPTEKRKAWEDLKFARSVFRRLEAGERVV